jgi:hypothetical protein
VCCAAWASRWPLACLLSVIADLGSDYLHITYDERARGKSKRSADCSFEGAARDLATGTSHPFAIHL